MCHVAEFHTQLKPWIVGLCLAVALANTHCSLLGGGDSIRRAADYTVVAPEHWRSRDPEKSDRAYQLPSGKVATLTSSCDRNADAPLPVLTKQLLMGARKIQFIKQDTLQVQGHPALHSTVKAVMDNQPFFFELLVTSRGSCVFDFVLISPTEVSDKERQDFLSFAMSLKYGTDQSTH